MQLLVFFINNTNMKNTFAILLVILGLVQFISAYSVYGYVKNEFSDPVKLVNVTLTEGGMIINFCCYFAINKNVEWVTEPSDAITGQSSSYVFFFEAEGEYS